MNPLVLVVIAVVAAGVTATAAWATRSVSWAPTAVAVTAAVSAGFALAAGGSPTGNAVVDAVLVCLVAVCFVVGSAAADPVPRVAALAVIAIGAADSSSAWAAFAAVGIAAGLAMPAGRRVVDGTLPGALAGALAVQAGLRLEGGAFHGEEALAVGVALVLLVASSVAQARPAVRRRALVALGAGCLLVLGATVVAGLGALSTRSTLDDAVDAASDGLTAARRGDRAEATRQFEESRELFADARATFGAWWAAPARAVPIVAQNAETLETMASEGERLAGVAAGVAAEVDPDSVRFQHGALDLRAVAAMVEPLERSASALHAASRSLDGAGSPWLLPPVANALDELTDEVAGAAPSADDAVAVAEVAPRLLGADGPRRYFLAFLTSAELRGSGGVLGSFGELLVTDGRLELVRTGRSADLNAGGTEESRNLDGAPDYLKQFSTGDLFWQDLPFSADFPSVGRAIEILYPRYGGVEVDGVIGIDPTAAAALLELTGPVTVEEWPEPLTSANAADVLLRQQYLRLGEGFTDEDRIDFLDSVVRAVFDRFESVDLPAPARVGEVLGPAVRERRLQLHLADEAGERLARRLDADGGLAPVQGDAVSFVTNNASGNKIDVFLRRSFEYRATVDPATGELGARAILTLRNDAPATGLPDYVIGSLGPVKNPPGTNYLQVALYTPHQLEAATVDGEPLPTRTVEERGRLVHSGYVAIPPGGTVRVELDLVGEVAVGDRYRLDIDAQPVLEPDDVAVSVEVPDGWVLGDGRHLRGDGPRATAQLELEQSEVLTAPYGLD